MKRGVLALLLAPLLMGQARPVSKPILVPDVSQRDIEIAYSFTGADLLLFGAILYPGGRLPDDNKPADVVVVIKGPVQSILLREKAKVAGIWVNAARLRYSSAPSFYAIASSRPVGQLIDQRTQAIYELGLDSLQLSPGSSAASTTSTALVVVAWTIVAVAVTNSVWNSEVPTTTCVPIPSR